jgi:hypothetical protein
MKMNVRMIGAAELDAKLAKLAEELRRSIPSLVKQQARSSATNFAFRSVPFGFQEPEKFRATIEAEVRRVYATRENPNAVYLLLRAVDPQQAEIYWSLHKKGKVRQANQILNSVSIQRGSDVGILKNARVGKGAHVPKKIAPRSLVTSTELRAIVKRQVRLAGFAKAGWYQAARAIGGRLRTNFTTADGVRGTKETFPAYLRKLANASPGIGGARQGGDEMSYFVEIFSSVKHAVEALPHGRQAEAERAARDFFVESCAKQLQIIREKIFRKAS